ncbi:MAG: Rpp14/Pop5 family protein [Candidatus Hodarchaeota archaeon]
MQPRRRYLAVHLHAGEKLPSEASFRNAIWQQLQELYGEFGVSRVGFWVIAYHPTESVAILRCQHDQVRPLRAALASLTHINSIPLIVEVVGISGTLRKVTTLLPELTPSEVIKPRKHR